MDKFCTKDVWGCSAAPEDFSCIPTLLRCVCVCVCVCELWPPASCLHVCCVTGNKRAPGFLFRQFHKPGVRGHSEPMLYCPQPVLISVRLWSIKSNPFDRRGAGAHILRAP